MRKLFIILCLIVPVLSLHARAIQENYRETEEKARVSYAFGILMGSNLRTVPMDFDYEAFTEGFRATMENTGTQFSEQEAMEIVEATLQRTMESRNEDNRLREAEFLARNMELPEVNVTPSGLQYVIIEDTEGEKPNANSVVRVIYEGTFIDGSPFDSSDEEEGAYIPLGMVIPGWTEGLMLMSVGSIYRFYIPSELGYGREGIQSIIPPYSTLIFTVNLLEITNDEGLLDFLNDSQQYDEEYNLNQRQ